MKKVAGLWIDRKKAVIVFFSGDEEKRSVVESGLDKKFHSEKGKGAVDSHGRYDLPKYDINERDFTGHLKSYLDKVVRHVRGAESVFIFGPGEAKTELVKRFEKIGTDIHIAATATADKMTDRQISVKVRKYFNK